MTTIAVRQSEAIWTLPSEIETFLFSSFIRSLLFVATDRLVVLALNALCLSVSVLVSHRDSFIIAVVVVVAVTGVRCINFSCSVYLCFSISAVAFSVRSAFATHQTHTEKSQQKIYSISFNQLPHTIVPEPEPFDNREELEEKRIARIFQFSVFFSSFCLFTQMCCSVCADDSVCMFVLWEQVKVREVSVPKKLFNFRVSQVTTNNRHWTDQLE